ncbi:hypothetical protein D1012_21870 [Pseudotabrizicola alkalilacus]|uniref:Uncharacterized protein n=1 Tax=Pseudotabrizicola alkalilacus TaxID=2305252 RepID=A0A411YWJ8_9RHOB|nr:hypothetical protein D1012_21870 [Pseudotabrizicola alkalilacus]
MGIDYKTYRKLTNLDFLARSSGVKQYVISIQEYHSFWDIVQCEARIRFNNFNRVDERYVNQLIDEIAFDLEDLESEYWGDYFNKTLSRFPDLTSTLRSPISAVEVIFYTYHVVQSVARRFMEYLAMLQKNDSERV